MVMLFDVGPILTGRLNPASGESGKRLHQKQTPRISGFRTICVKMTLQDRSGVTGNDVGEWEDEP